MHNAGARAVPDFCAQRSQAPYLCHGRLDQASSERHGHRPWAFPVPSPGAEAFWLVAQDQDNDHLTYGISGPNAYFFTVTLDTGKVDLASPLDYEVKDSSLGGHEGNIEMRRALGGSVLVVGALPVPPPCTGAHLGHLFSTCRRRSTGSKSSSL